MSLSRIIATATAASALFAAPALAGAAGPPSDAGNGHRPATAPAAGPNAQHPTSDDNPGTSKRATPGPDASHATKAKAYGKSCQGQSKKHVKGEKGTAFSRCVTAMAKVASGASDSAKAACKGLSKKHVKGEKGTPFSRCVVAAAKLLKQRHAADDDDAGDTTPSTTEPTTTEPTTTTPTTTS